MDKKQRHKEFITPFLSIFLLLIVYTRLTGTENIRAIYIVTLMALGMSVSILARNAIAYFRDKL